jgi:hypothetical protein
MRIAAANLRWARKGITTFVAAPQRRPSKNDQRQFVWTHWACRCVLSVGLGCLALAGLSNEPAYAVIPDCGPGQVGVVAMAMPTGTCGPGMPPSIAAASSEVSTAEVLELVRERRRTRLAGQASQGAFLLGAGSLIEPNRVGAARDVRVGSGLTFGVWANGYVSYEEHRNLSPSEAAAGGFNPTRKSTVGGFLGGADWTYRVGGNPQHGAQWGVFAGYNWTESKFTGIDDPPPDQLQLGSGKRHRLTGPMVGTYASYFNHGFSADLTFKVDLFNLDPGYVTAALQDDIGPDNPAISSVDLVTYTLAANVNQKFYVSPQRWIEPTAGIMYVWTDYDKDAVNFYLADGEALRVQGGVRVGRHDQLERGTLTTTLTSLLYSDVYISGFSTGEGLSPDFSPVDEGKLRGQVILKAQMDYGTGLSNFLEVGAHGGEDVWGVGGKVGIRYQW